ncbi:type II CRISPR RNA-guided endonuclease Cas9 [uncultured Fibrobacter sp.]|uniref:type II CRISPR RNA-guided endonuclease Cas9 n=1 Tax=uncultured Fibrobacter sp. TaxID=261512 RepID=UPI002805B01F|nr:type II CRISPR RNA-guided endonuclease Cas9 [uncultured Fibrobacter sp.]
MKRILGLDLGTNSIGWAVVNEAETGEEKSSIVKLGVRVNPLTVDEQQNFEKGKSITTNADRTLKRSMRRNLQRYKLRRQKLIEILKKNKWITDETILAECGNKTTFETYRLRAKAATEEISLSELSRVLLMINKKRGYKSSRKAKGTEDGQLIDGMDIAKKMYEGNLTPGQYCLQLLDQKKKYLPDFYRSDLQAEFDKIWNKQKEFYPFLTDELKEELKGKNEKATWAICKPKWKWIEASEEKTLVGEKRTGSAAEQKIENFKWREKALSEKMLPEQLIIVLQKINGQINASSGYLGAISDRSKELCFNKQTVGQYQMAVLDANPNASLRNMVFYRQDYLDEFETIWETQAKFHKELTLELKKEIRDVVIFYQRPLKSCKNLIAFCEFESRQIEVDIDGKKKTKTVGSHVIPRSSPLFQEFKIWQTLNNIEISGKVRCVENADLFGEKQNYEYGKRYLSQEEKELLAKELFICEKMSDNDVLKLLFKRPQGLMLNFKTIDGDKTGSALFKAFCQIVEASGHTIDIKQSAEKIIGDIRTIFGGLGWSTDILDFDSGKELDSQPFYRLWHLLYSFDGNGSKTGNEKLIDKLTSLYGFDKESAKILAGVTFLDDYGSLSAKAIRKILPFMKEGNGYDVACVYAGYGTHSKSSLTKEEIENKILKEHLDILPKNSLRNPVVEKILNQMVNVVNQLVDAYGEPNANGEKHFDEIRVELARELKKNAKEREELTKAISQNTKLYEEYREILSKPPFNLSHISRNDIIRYRLYKELEANSYKTLYSNTYISPNELFSGKFDIEHIIPQARLFDDSFSNKTLELSSINLEKGNSTAYDFVRAKYGDDGLSDYLDRLDRLCNAKSKAGDNGENKTEGDEKSKSAEIISKAKYKKLKMTEAEIPEGFINRDLRNTQYITKKALEMLNTITRRVVSTSGSITDELREDWGLIDIMKELNWDKYHALGLTETIEDRRIDDQGKEKINRISRIKKEYWTKRNDHRHHAMDALTVAFTKDVFIQYFNNKNASFKPNTNEYAIKQKYFENRRAIAPIPLNEFRAEAKRQLENILISIKAKNKVVTRNINISKKKGGLNKIVQQTPRGQLHKETVYGRYQEEILKMEKVDAKFTAEKIESVCNGKYREALKTRLAKFSGDPKVAFAGKNALSKNPLYWNGTQIVPEKVKTKTYQTTYTIRKKISPDLKIDKVVDVKIRELLQKRLEEYKGNAKAAFAEQEMEQNPIWQNKEKGIAIKYVTIFGIDSAKSLHIKHDHLGREILDSEGNKIPTDFVSTGNNHHVAIYRFPKLDKKGNSETDEQGNPIYELEEKVVSFFEATARANAGLSIIDREYKKDEGWQFMFTMKQNEYFVFPKYEKYIDDAGEEKERMVFNPQEHDEAWYKDPANYAEISPNLFRVQKFSSKDYFFRHHLETKIEDRTELKEITWKRIKALDKLAFVLKVRINHIGQIVAVGEY